MQTDTDHETRRLAGITHTIQRTAESRAQAAQQARNNTAGKLSPSCACQQVAKQFCVKAFFQSSLSFSTIGLKAPTQENSWANSYR